jgi:hypothetical protein
MTSENTCYAEHDYIIVVSSNDLPCGTTNSSTPYVPCCARGDTCLSDGICSYTHSLDGGSGFYGADCTDSTFGANTCRKLCNTSIIYMHERLP